MPSPTSNIVLNTRMPPDWQDLLPELLAAIAKRLTSIRDYVFFRGVCNSWRSAASFDNFDSAFPRVPWFMFAKQKLKKPKHRDQKKRLKHAFKLWDLSRDITFKLANFPVEEEPNKKYLSCSGWLLGVAESSVRINLTHPICSIRVELPDLDTFPGFTNNLSKSDDSIFIPFIRKMVLSGSPTIESDFVIMVIWGEKNQLGFSRPGDSSWTVMDYWEGSFTDILYHKGKLYAIDANQTLVECDIHGRNPTRIQHILSLPTGSHQVDIKYQCYIVESSGKFLIVSENPVYYLGFRVCEFDLMDRSHKEIFGLGNKTLFLSHGSSLCLEGFAWNGPIRPNCIFFADSGKYYCLTYFGPKKFFRRVYSFPIRLPIWVAPRF